MMSLKLLILVIDLFILADGVIAVNKPFGVGVANIVAKEEERLEKLTKQGKTAPKDNTPISNLYHARGIGACDYTLEDILPDLKKVLELPSLELVKSTEK
jgi:hypothetical protein